MTKQERQRKLAPANIHPTVYLGLYENIELDVTYKKPEIKKGDHQEVIRRVAEFFDLNATDIKGSSRKMQFTKPRHIAIFLLHRHSKVTLKAVGRLFNDRDHTTVINSCKVVEDSMQTDKLYRQEFYKCCGFVFGNVPKAIERHLRPLKIKQHGKRESNHSKR